VSGVVVNSENADHDRDALDMSAQAEQVGVALRHQHVVASDDVVESLIAAASDYDAALLCVGSHGRGPLGQAIVGSVGVEVLALSPAPVLVIGPEATPAQEFGCVIVCVDGSETALRAVEPARAWARAMRTALRIIYVAGLDHARRPEHVPPEAEILFDPDTAGILARYAVDTDAALVVATTHGHTGLATIGGTAIALIRKAPCALLLLGPNAKDSPE
jgi:nucleotide-binding universal stress UspA family protein